MNKQEEIEKLFLKFNEKLISENIYLPKEEILKNLHNISLNGKYIMWIMIRYISGGIQRYEDMGRVQDCLSVYQSYSADNRLKYLNFMAVKTLTELEDILFPFMENKRKKDLEKLNKEKVYAETEFIYEGPEGRILIPKTKESSIFWGQGTRWCTAATNNNMFDRYNQKGPLYIFVLPEKDEEGREIKYQLHIETEQFMDIRDKEVKTLSFSALSLLDVFFKKTKKSYLELYLMVKESKSKQKTAKKIFNFLMETNLSVFMFFMIGFLYFYTIYSGGENLDDSAKIFIVLPVFFYFICFFVSIVFSGQRITIGNFSGKLENVLFCLNTFLINLSFYFFPDKTGLFICMLVSITILSTKFMYAKKCLNDMRKLMMVSKA